MISRLVEMILRFKKTRRFNVSFFRDEDATVPETMEAKTEPVEPVA